MMQQSVLEILTWKSALNVEDSSMIKAMEIFSEDVSSLPGFIHQTLYKNANAEWVCIYYWKTAEQAHDSNTLVAEKASFHSLMGLIEKQNITMEVMKPISLQQNKE